MVTPTEIDLLVAERCSGAEIKALAQRFGIHRNTVMLHLNRRGVPGHRWLGRTLNDEELEQAGSLYASGVRIELVANQFGVDRRYLRRLLPGAGFEIRRGGQQKRSPEWAQLAVSRAPGSA